MKKKTKGRIIPGKLTKEELLTAIGFLNSGEGLLHLAGSAAWYVFYYRFQREPLTDELTVPVMKPQSLPHLADLQALIQYDQHNESDPMVLARRVAKRYRFEILNREDVAAGK